MLRKITLALSALLVLASVPALGQDLGAKSKKWADAMDVCLSRPENAKQQCYVTADQKVFCPNKGNPENKVVYDRCNAEARAAVEPSKWTGKDAWGNAAQACFDRPENRAQGCYVTAELTGSPAGYCPNKGAPGNREILEKCNAVGAIAASPARLTGR